MARYDANAHDVAKHMYERLPDRVRREKGREFRKLLRSRRIGGVRHIGNREQAEKVANAVLDLATESEHFSSREERHTRRKVKRGHERHMKEIMGLTEEQSEEASKGKSRSGSNRTKKGHMKPPSGIDGKNERLAMLRAKRTGASEEDINALREAINLEQRKKSQELSQKELQAIAHKEMMRRLVKEAHGWKKDGDKEGEEDEKKHKLGSTPEAAAEEISSRQAVQRPPEVHGPPSPPAS